MHKLAYMRPKLGRLPEGDTDRQFAVSDVLEPHLVDHSVSVVKSESPTVRQEGRCEQAVSNQLLLLSIKGLQRCICTQSVLPASEPCALASYAPVNSWTH